jgi:hypothetical protein
MKNVSPGFQAGELINFLSRLSRFKGLRRLFFADYQIENGKKLEAL